MTYIDFLSPTDECIETIHNTNAPTRPLARRVNGRRGGRRTFVQNERADHGYLNWRTHRRVESEYIYCACQAARGVHADEISAAMHDNYYKVM